MRRNRATKRKVLPDPRYKSPLVTKFINNIMVDGKKPIAEKIVYGALTMVVEEEKKSKNTHVKKNKATEGDDQGGDEGTTTTDTGSVGSTEPHVDILRRVLEAVGPKVEVKSRRVGGSTYQVPIEVREDRRIALAMRWLRDSAKKRSEKSMTQRLAREILDALGGRGGAMKKREETFKMAEANKAFAHYRW